MSDVGPNGEPCFVCPACSWVTYHPNDIANRYCGNCHRFILDGWEGDDSGYRDGSEPWAEEAARQPGNHTDL